MGTLGKKRGKKFCYYFLLDEKVTRDSKKQITKRSDAKAKLEFFSTLKGKTHYTILEI